MTDLQKRNSPAGDGAGCAGTAVPNEFSGQASLTADHTAAMARIKGWRLVSLWMGRKQLLSGLITVRSAADDRLALAKKSGDPMYRNAYVEIVPLGRGAR